MNVKGLKNKIHSIISCFLALFIVMCCFVSCKQHPAEPSTQERVLNTIHGGTVEKTSEFLVKGGKTEYVLLKASNATSEEIKAISYIREYFAEATGIALSISEDDIGWTESSKVISVGNTNAAKNANVTYVSTELKDSGFIIKSSGKSIFLMGGSYGIQYAAFELLKYLFNFEYYAPECYEIDKGVSEVSFYIYDIKEIPDIEYRWGGISFETTDTHYTTALRTTHNYAMTSYKGELWHNSFDILPLEEYFDENPEWYAYRRDGGIPTQLCYSRKVDEWLPVVLDKCKPVLAESNATILNFQIEDNRDWCECELCSLANAKYHGNGGVFAQFLNRLADKIKEWQESAERPVENRKIYVCGAAYQPTEYAPVDYDEKTDTYKAVDNSVVLRENVCLLYAPIDANYYVSLYDEGNERETRNLKGWSAISQHMMFWIYNQRDFTEFLIFYDNFSSMQENYQIAVEKHAMWLFDQGQVGGGNPTAFNILRKYLMSKLAWNCQIDYEQTMDDFFRVYFNDAAPAMRELFETLRNRWAYFSQIGRIAAGSWSYFDKEMYPYAYLQLLMDYIEQAYKDIEPLKVHDKKEYDKIYDRINLESISIRYMLLQLHGDSYIEKDLRKEMLLFKEDCTLLNVTRWGESTVNRKITDLYKYWGIN